MNDDDKCPKCGKEVMLYTKPNGNYLACSNCDWTSEAYMERIK